MNISLTISQIENLKEFIEFEFIGSIRDDEDDYQLYEGR